jgi:hypothetical protein
VAMVTMHGRSNDLSEYENDRLANLITLWCRDRGNDSGDWDRDGNRGYDQRVRVETTDRSKRHCDIPWPDLWSFQPAEFNTFYGLPKRFAAGHYKLTPFGI